jgi:hypothetical protein
MRQYKALFYSTTLAHSLAQSLPKEDPGDRFGLA